MYNIVFSPEAIKDLKEIKKYISEELYNEKAALKLIAEILNNIQTLSDFPLSGPGLLSVVNFESDYRFLVCGKYIAFYSLYENEVRIVRIIYSRRNYMQILFEDFFDDN